jgi:hypothetical protein
VRGADEDYGMQRTEDGELRRSCKGENRPEAGAKVRAERITEYGVQITDLKGMD